MKTNLFLRMLVAATMLLPLSGLKAQFIENYGTLLPATTLLNENGTTVRTCADGDYITADRHFNGVDWDMYVVRTTNTGAIIWAKWFPMPGTNEKIYSIKEVPALNGGPFPDFIMTGYITTGLLGAGPTDVLVHRITFNGGILWTMRYGNPGNDQGRDIIEVPAAVFPFFVPDGFVVAGSTETTPGNRDYYALRIDQFGGVIWQNAYPGILPSGDETANSVLYNVVSENLNILGYSNFFTAFPPSYAATLLNVDPATGAAFSIISYDIPVPAPFGWNEYGYKIIQLTGPAGPGDLMLLCRTDYGPSPNNIWVIRTDPFGAVTWATVYDYITDDEQASIVENLIPVPPFGFSTVTFSHVRRFGGGADFICHTNIDPMTGAINWSNMYDQIVYTPEDLTHSLDFVPAAGAGGHIQLSTSNINTVGGLDFHLIETDAFGGVMNAAGVNCYSRMDVRRDSPWTYMEQHINYNPIQPSAPLSTFDICIGKRNVLCSDTSITDSDSCIQIGQVIFDQRKPHYPSGINVYPNPSNGHIALQFSLEEDAEVGLELYNVTGQLLMVKAITVAKGWSEESFDLSNYAPGIYLLKVQQGGQMEYHKILIE